MKHCFAAVFGATIVLAGIALPAVAEDRQPQQHNDPKFLGIDLDNGSAYFNGRNSGRFCIYQTIPIYNPYTGYFEYQRVRRCGRGLYL